MQKVLVTGAEGLLGTELVGSHRAGFEVVGLGREECDVTDLDSVRAALERVRPDIVVNCAVVVSVDRCEENPQRCRAVNTGGVKNLLLRWKPVFPTVHRLQRRDIPCVYERTGSALRPIRLLH